MSGDIIQELWNDHVWWSITADLLKKQRSTWRAITLCLTVIGAVLETTSSTLDPSRLKTASGLIGTIALLLVPIFTKYFLSQSETQKWLRARSISEGIKSEVFSYLAGGAGYTSEDALVRLIQKAKDIRSWGSNLELERAKITPPNEAAPSELDAKGYLETRIREQANEYYRPKAKSHALSADRFRAAEIFLACSAAVISGISTFLGDSASVALGPWVAVITTVSGGVVAHAAANRYDFQATTFFATARQLDDLAQEWEISRKTAPGPEWAEFVRSCEQVISAENRAWMAKLDDKSQS